MTRCGLLEIAAMVAVAASASCAFEPREEASRTLHPQDLGVSRVALEDGPSAELDVQLAPITCTSSMGYREGMLPDPATGRRGPTLLTGLECTYDGGHAPPERDVLLALHRRLDCFDAGDPEEPESWQPLQGHAVEPIEESYGAITSAYGDAYLNTATLLSAISDYAFCRYEAWAVVRTTPLDASPRAAGVRMGAAVGHWLAMLTPDGDGGFDCGFSPGGTSEARLGYARAVAWGPASQEQKGRFPAAYESVIVLEAELSTGTGALGVAHGLEAVASTGAPFPVTAGTRVPGFVRRLLWVEDPGSGQVADARLTAGCALVAEDGTLDAVALWLEEYWSRAPLGAVRITRRSDGAFDCERASSEGPCRLLSPDEAYVAAPCLATRPAVP